MSYKITMMNDISYCYCFDCDWGCWDGCVCRIFSSYTASINSTIFTCRMLVGMTSPRRHTSQLAPSLTVFYNVRKNKSRSIISHCMAFCALQFVIRRPKSCDKAANEHGKGLWVCCYLRFVISFNWLFLLLVWTSKKATELLFHNYRPFKITNTWKRHHCMAALIG